MINLKRIVEQLGTESQYYDLGKDFSNFRRTIDGADEQVKQRFEKIINSKLIGKRVQAQASRGYKQFVKTYEFDISKVTIDDYYDNYVVIAHDNTTPKAKEYFLKPGFKINILGQATGQPSPQKGGKPTDIESPSVNLNNQHQPMKPAPAGNITVGQPALKENEDNGYYDAYSVDDISKDIQYWLKPLLIKPETTFRDFIKKQGWKKNIDSNTKVAIYDIQIPFSSLKNQISKDELNQKFEKINVEGSNIGVKFTIVKMDPNEFDDGWDIRIKKTDTNKI